MKVQINIARNDRETNEPMSSELWESFIYGVQKCFHNSTKTSKKFEWLAGGVYECFSSGEESFFALADVGYSFDRVMFQIEIHALAMKFNQDSIAVSYIYDGDNFLIRNISTI